MLRGVAESQSLHAAARGVLQKAGKNTPLDARGSHAGALRIEGQDSGTGIADPAYDGGRGDTGQRAGARTSMGGVGVKTPAALAESPKVDRQYGAGHPVNLSNSMSRNNFQRNSLLGQSLEIKRNEILIENDYAFRTQKRSQAVPNYYQKLGNMQSRAAKFAQNQSLTQEVEKVNVPLNLLQQQLVMRKDGQKSQGKSYVDQVEAMRQSVDNIIGDNNRNNQQAQTNSYKSMFRNSNNDKNQLGVRTRFKAQASHHRDYIYNPTSQDNPLIGGRSDDLIPLDRRERHSRPRPSGRLEETASPTATRPRPGQAIETQQTLRSPPSEPGAEDASRQARGQRADVSPGPRRVTHSPVVAVDPAEGVATLDTVGLGGDDHALTYASVDSQSALKQPGRYSRLLRQPDQLLQPVPSPTVSHNNSDIMPASKRRDTGRSNTLSRTLQAARELVPQADAKLSRNHRAADGRSPGRSELGRMVGAGLLAGRPFLTTGEDAASAATSLARPPSRGPADVTDGSASRLTRPEDVQKYRRYQASKGGQHRYRNQRARQRAAQVPFSVMTPAEKKERVAHLWGVVRGAVQAQVLLARVKRGAARFLVQRVEEPSAAATADPELNSDASSAAPSGPWYLLRAESLTVGVVSLISLLATAYDVVGMPLLLSLREDPNLISQRGLDYWAVLHYTTTCFWLFHIVLGLFTLPPKETNADLRRNIARRLRSASFWTDIFTVVPSGCLFVYSRSAAGLFSLLRIFNIRAVYEATRYLYRRCLRRRHEQAQVLALITFLLFTLLLIAHILTCSWLAAGLRDFNKPREERASWMFVLDANFRSRTGPEYDIPVYDQLMEGKTTFLAVYLYAQLYLFTVLTTVGYGHSAYGESGELLLAMLFMFFSPWLQPIVIQVSLKAASLYESSFKSLLAQRLTEIDLWIIKIQKQRALHHEFLSPRLVAAIIDYQQDAMTFDFNLIVEEFTFYQQLPPRMQTQLVEHVFADFLKKFDAFLGHCEDGFRNEFVIQMHMRRYQPGQEVVWYQRQVEEISFISAGGVDMVDAGGHTFMRLPPSAVVGDYAVMFGLVSNVVARAYDPDVTVAIEDRQTQFMCCRAEVFHRLCELYPATRDRVKEMALLKREVYMHFRGVASEMRGSHSGQPPMDSPRDDRAVGRAVISEEFERSHGLGSPAEEAEVDRLNLLRLYRNNFSKKNLEAQEVKEMSKDYRLARNKYFTLKQLNYKGCKVIKDIVMDFSDFNLVMRIMKELSEGVYDYMLPSEDEGYFKKIPNFQADEGNAQYNVETVEETDQFKVQYSVKMLDRLGLTFKKLKLDMNGGNILINDVQYGNLLREDIEDKIKDYVYQNQKHLEVQDVEDIFSEGSMNSDSSSYAESLTSDSGDENSRQLVHHTLMRREQEARQFIKDNIRSKIERGRDTHDIIEEEKKLLDMMQKSDKLMSDVDMDQFYKIKYRQFKALVKDVSQEMDIRSRRGFKKHESVLERAKTRFMQRQLLDSIESDSFQSDCKLNLNHNDGNQQASSMLIEDEKHENPPLMSTINTKSAQLGLHTLKNSPGLHKNQSRYDANEQDKGDISWRFQNAPIEQPLKSQFQGLYGKVSSNIVKSDKSQTNQRKNESIQF